MSCDTSPACPHTDWPCGRHKFGRFSSWPPRSSDVCEESFFAVLRTKPLLPCALHTDNNWRSPTRRPGHPRRFPDTRCCHTTRSGAGSQKKEISSSWALAPLERGQAAAHWLLWLSPVLHVTRLWPLQHSSAIMPSPLATTVVQRAGSSLVIACVTSGEAA